MVAWQVVSKGGQSVSSSKNRAVLCAAPADWTNTNKMLNLRGWEQNSPRKVSLFCQFCCTFAIEHQKGRTAHAIYHIAKCVSHAPNLFFSFLEKCVFSPWQMFEQARQCSFGLTKTFFFVPRKVRFLAMTMFEQARHCSFGLTKTFLTTWRKPPWHKPNVPKLLHYQKDDIHWIAFQPNTTNHVLPGYGRICGSKSRPRRMLFHVAGGTYCAVWQKPTHRKRGEPWLLSGAQH